MATVPGYGQLILGGVHEEIWTPITSGDVGSWLDASQYPDKTVQVAGVWGGATLVIQGSNDGGTTAFTLTDPQGNAIFATTDIMEQVQENPKAIRPNCTVGGASTSLTARLISRRESP